MRQAPDAEVAQLRGKDAARGRVAIDDQRAAGRLVAVDHGHGPEVYRPRTAAT
jgi:hypothetical protein